MKLEDHPTVRRLSKKDEGIEDKKVAETTLEGTWLRHLAMDCGADDTGLVFT